MSAHLVMFLLVTSAGLWTVSQIWDLLHWDVPALQSRAILRVLWARLGEVLREMGV